MSMVLPSITHNSSINESTDLLSMQCTEPVSTIIAPTNTFPSFPLNATFTIGNPTCFMSLSFDHCQDRSATPPPFPRPWSVAEWAGKRRNRAMTGQEVASNTKKMKEETAVSPRLIKYEELTDEYCRQNLAPKKSLD